MRFYVVGYTPETWQYPGNVTFFCYDAAGNLIEQFDFIQPGNLLSYENREEQSFDYALCRPFRISATQDGFLYSINTLMSAYDYDAHDLVVVRNESVTKYDCNGFRRAFDVNFQVYPREVGTYYAERNRLTAIATNGNDQILIGMQTDELLSESTYNTYFLSVDADGDTAWSLTSPTPPYYSSGDDVSMWESYFASNPLVNPLRVSVVDIVSDDSDYLYILTSKFIEKRDSSGILQWRRWMNPGTDSARISKVGGYLFVMVNADFYYDTDGYTKISYQPPGSYDYAKITKWAASDGAFGGFVTNISLFGTSSVDWYLRTENGAAGGTNLYALNTAYYELDSGLSVLQSINYHSDIAKYASPGRVFRIASNGTLFSTKESYEPNPIVVSSDPATTNWSVSIAENPVSGTNHQLSCCALIEDEQTPPIPLPSSLAIPSWTGDRYVSPPPLAMPIALGSPRGVTDVDERYAPAVVCTLTLDNGSTTLELPLASFSVRYYDDGASVSVVCPLVDLATVTAVEALGECELIVRRGYRFPAGETLLAELVRGTLSPAGVRYDAGPNRASLSLDATGAAEAPYSPRIMRGIRYRAEINGRRRVRCQLDTYLRPGGVAIIGAGESMTVGEITYTVSTDQEYMDIAEAS